ncbi:MAG: hypothetical protein ABIQ88_02345 [Chitinophagaceae bacterium]
MQQQTRLFLYPPDFLKIYDHLTTYMGAYYRYKAIKKLLGKQKHQFITVKEFADWEGVAVEEIIKRIE